MILVHFSQSFHLNILPQPPRALRCFSSEVVVSEVVGVNELLNRMYSKEFFSVPTFFMESQVKKALFSWGGNRTAFLYSSGRRSGTTVRLEAFF